MSYVGGQYDYDIFFSYAVAEDAGATSELGRWSRCVIDTIVTRLQVALNARAPSSKRRFRAFRDDLEITAGQPIVDRLEEAVKRSALIVVLVSPFYWRRPWCRRELTWWHESISDAHDYSSYLLQIQRTERKDWPPPLKDRSHVPFNSTPLMDDWGQPEGLTLPGEDISRRLYDPITQTCRVLIERLEDKRKLLDAMEHRKLAAQPAAEKIILLEAEPDDLAHRSSVFADLRDHKVRVMPEQLVGYQASGEPQRLSPDQFYPVCNSIVLLRTRKDDNIELRLVKASMDRDERRAARQPLAWAVCNELVGEKVPSAEVLGVPVVDRAGDHWVDELLSRLA